MRAKILLGPIPSGLERGGSKRRLQTAQLLIISCVHRGSGGFGFQIAYSADSPVREGLNDPLGRIWISAPQETLLLRDETIALASLGEDLRGHYRVWFVGDCQGADVERLDCFPPTSVFT